MTLSDKHMLGKYYSHLVDNKDVIIATSFMRQNSDHFIRILFLRAHYINFESCENQTTTTTVKLEYGSK